MINIDEIIKNKDVKENIKFLCNYSSDTDIDYYIQEFIVSEIISGKVPGYEFITNEDKAWDIVKGLCSCMEALFTIFYDYENNEIIAGTITQGVYSGCVTDYASLPLKKGTDLYDEWHKDEEMFDETQIDWKNFDRILSMHSHPTGMLSPSLSDIICDEFAPFVICGNLNGICRFKTYIQETIVDLKRLSKYDNFSSSYMFTPKEELLMADIDTFSDMLHGVAFIHLNIYNERDTLEIERINETTLNDYYSIKEYKI